MEEQYLIPQLKKLLSTLIFNKVGIEFDVENTPDEQFIKYKYILTIKKAWKDQLSHTTSS
jgi:hypothetical protein